MFRSENVGVGIRYPASSENIALVGIGDVILRGAKNPRATGDGEERYDAILLGGKGYGESSRLWCLPGFKTTATHNLRTPSKKIFIMHVGESLTSRL
jgi:hypothetical protein